MKTNKSVIKIFNLKWSSPIYFEQRENWFVDREQAPFSYRSSLQGEEAAEEAFHLTNAPEEYLTDEQKKLLKEENFRGPSLSVGDIVRVEPIVRGKTLPEYYLCKSIGWEKFHGNTIQLLKHLAEL